MNVIKFGQYKKRKIVFCFLDTLHLCQDNFTKEIIKNQSDYVISSLISKRFNVYQGQDEDQLLGSAAEDGYECAVMFSTGTEFINGNIFFKKTKELVNTDFFLCGHVLDRKDAYYELHQQCYIINLKIYEKLGRPLIGKHTWNSPHQQIEPKRSLENFHDEYTPKYVMPGTDLKDYQHKCHGWNILKTAFENQLQVLVFDEEFRSGKTHHYPESRKDFYKNLRWIYYRENECLYNFVHTANSEFKRRLTGQYEQIVIPASGTLYLNLIDKGDVIIYDYNQKSLDYWQEHLPRKENVNYNFVKTDLLIDNNLIDQIQDNKSTLINLSNIFAYEGTAAFKPLFYRLHKENQLIESLQKKIPDIFIIFSIRSVTGFLELPLTGNSSLIKTTDIEKLKRPTWHHNDDWLIKPLQY